MTARALPYLALPYLAAALMAWLGLCLAYAAGAYVGRPQPLPTLHHGVAFHLHTHREMYP